jgi:hypothetical protein
MHPSERNYIPGRQLKAKVEDRKERFAALVTYARERNGWLTSVPGAPTVTMECLPDSTLPDALRDLGYIVEQVGTTDRILANAITERFTRGPRGELELLKPGSTEAAVEVRHDAGVTRVLVYEFDVP